ncbi:MAG: flagellar motor switch protein FliG [Pararhizobium sp.]
MTYAEFGVPLQKPLSKPEKAAAILLAMGKPVAGKLLKFFEQGELQTIIARAQTLRSVPPDELAGLVEEFEELFTEGAGLMDNAKAMEGILEEGLTPDEVDGLLGRRAAFVSDDAPIWERMQRAEPEAVVAFLAEENLQTAAYVVSMLPSNFAGSVLTKMPEKDRAAVVHRALNMKAINPRAAAIIEGRVEAFVARAEAERTAGSEKVVEVMNELQKEDVESILDGLETISKADADRVRPKVFLFDDLVVMPLKSRVVLFNDLSGEIITLALRGAPEPIREAARSSIGARPRRMIEADLAGEFVGNARDVATARRTIVQEAIRLSTSGRIILKEEALVQAAA